ncbi:hypothetical protein B484DRAFT_441237 [Ochromonadaceae sp. CCMP2298]|nr:hypothetical protein B484DRAFT_441237 [Ochromonadaceae sp. CCMP2298]
MALIVCALNILMSFICWCRAVVTLAVISDLVTVAAEDTRSSLMRPPCCVLMLMIFSMSEASLPICRSIANSLAVPRCMSLPGALILYAHYSLKSRILEHRL